MDDFLWGVVDWLWNNEPWKLLMQLLFAVVLAFALELIFYKPQNASDDNPKIDRPKRWPAFLVLFLLIIVAWFIVWIISRGGPSALNASLNILRESILEIFFEIVAAFAILVLRWFVSKLAKKSIRSIIAIIASASACFFFTIVFSYAIESQSAQSYPFHYLYAEYVAHTPVFLQSASLEYIDQLEPETQRTPQPATTAPSTAAPSSQAQPSQPQTTSTSGATSEASQTQPVTTAAPETQPTTRPPIDPQAMSSTELLNQILQLRQAGVSGQSDLEACLDEAHRRVTERPQETKAEDAHTYAMLLWYLAVSDRYDAEDRKLWRDAAIAFSENGEYYNAGLAYEHLGETELAASMYAKYVEPMDFVTIMQQMPNAKDGSPIAQKAFLESAYAKFKQNTDVMLAQSDADTPSGLQMVKEMWEWIDNPSMGFWQTEEEHVRFLKEAADAYLAHEKYWEAADRYYAIGEAEYPAALDCYLKTATNSKVSEEDRINIYVEKVAAIYKAQGDIANMQSALEAAIEISNMESTLEKAMDNKQLANQIDKAYTLLGESYEDTGKLSEAWDLYLRLYNTRHSSAAVDKLVGILKNWSGAGQHETVLKHYEDELDRRESGGSALFTSESELAATLIYLRSGLLSITPQTDFKRFDLTYMRALASRYSRSDKLAISLACLEYAVAQSNAGREMPKAYSDLLNRYTAAADAPQGGTTEGRSVEELKTIAANLEPDDRVNLALLLMRSKRYVSAFAVAAFADYENPDSVQAFTGSRVDAELYDESVLIQAYCYLASKAFGGESDLAGASERANMRGILNAIATRYNDKAGKEGKRGEALLFASILQIQDDNAAPKETLIDEALRIIGFSAGNNTYLRAYLDYLEKDYESAIAACDELLGNNDGERLEQEQGFLASVRIIKGKAHYDLAQKVKNSDDESYKKNMDAAKDEFWKVYEQVQPVYEECKEMLQKIAREQGDESMLARLAN